MKIIKFEAENVKRLKAVEITPNGAVVLIGGRNGQGKSSILDSIMVALGGKKYEDKKMVRDGKKKGFVELDLGDFLVRRTFTEAGGGLLTIKSADGEKMASPQAILDALIGQVSFDPLSFVRAGENDQANIIRDLAGLDLTDIETKRQEIYDDRTFLNREIKNLELELDKKEHNEDPKYLEPIDAKALISEMAKARDINTNIGVAQTEIDNIGQLVTQCLSDKQQALQEIADLQKEIKALELKEEGFKSGLEQHEKFLKDNKEIDLEPLEEKLINCESHNDIYKLNCDFAAAQVYLESKVDEAELLTKSIKEKDAEKEKMIKAASMPIAGLSFDEAGVLTYQNIPFTQASQAESIRVSVAIGIAMNPRLKVLLIKDGSLLDEDNLKMIGKMAQLKDAQLWVETVGTRDGVSVVMEDGVSKDPVVEQL